MLDDLGACARRLPARICQLDLLRNRILRFELLMNVCQMVLGVGALVSGRTEGATYTHAHASPFVLLLPNLRCFHRRCSLAGPVQTGVDGLTRPLARLPGCLSVCRRVRHEPAQRLGELSARLLAGVCRAGRGHGRHVRHGLVVRQAGQGPLSLERPNKTGRSG